MPQCNIIVDSCSYFRLAKSIRPLLKNTFGKEKHCLGVIEELDKEYEKNPILKRKFFWVNEREYADNRKKCFNLTMNQRTSINHAFYFIRESARERQIGVSEVDITALSYAYVRKIPVVTDDSDMLEIAKEYNIVTYKTLEILNLMLDAGLVKMKQIRSIASFWVYLNDTPKSYRSDYKRIFKKEAPD